MQLAKPQAILAVLRKGPFRPSKGLKGIKLQPALSQGTPRQRFSTVGLHSTGSLVTRELTHTLAATVRDSDVSATTSAKAPKVHCKGKCVLLWMNEVVNISNEAKYSGHAIPASHLQIAAAAHVRWTSYNDLQKVQAAQT